MQQTTKAILELMEATPLETALSGAAEAYGNANISTSGELERAYKNSLNGLLNLLGKLKAKNANLSGLGWEETEQAAKLFELSRSFNSLIKTDEGYQTLCAVKAATGRSNAQKAEEAVAVYKFIKMIPYLKQYGLLEIITGGEDNG